MGWMTGFEPATRGTTIRCSNQLSYIHQTAKKRGADLRGVQRRPPRGPISFDFAGPGCFSCGLRWTLEKLTQKSREALASAQAIASEYGHTEVDAEHLLLALLRQEGGLAPRLFGRWACPSTRSPAAGRDASSSAGRASRARAASPARSTSPSASSRLVRAAEAAKRLKDEYVSVEHLLLALAGEPARPASARRCAEFNVSRDRLLAGAARGARQPARDQRRSRGHLRGAREVRPRPREGGARRASSTR